MKCKYCNKNIHWCRSCGVEEYCADYCSISCLEKDGKKICEKCNGWGDLADIHENDSEYCPGWV